MTFDIDTISLNALTLRDWARSEIDRAWARPGTKRERFTLSGLAHVHQSAGRLADALAFDGMYSDAQKLAAYVDCLRSMHYLNGNKGVL